MTVFSRSSLDGETVNHTLITPRELILEHALLLKRQATLFSEIHSTTVILGKDYFDAEIYQGMLKRTAESLVETVTALEELAERGRSTRSDSTHTPGWRVIFQMVGTVAAGMLLAIGLLLAAVWLFDEPPTPDRSLSEQEWMAMKTEPARPELKPQEGKP